MKRGFMWFVLLNKRLYKKAAFVIILALIPLMVVALNMVAQQDSGFVTIALAQEDPTDPISSAIVEDLMGKQRLIRFVDCASSDEAQRMVTNHRADAAWLFVEDMSERVEEFVDTRSEALVTVFLREQTVPIRLSHEKLVGAVYKYCAQTAYLTFAREETPELDGLSDEQVMSYYFGFEQKNPLFAFAYPDGEVMTDAEDAGYLVAPIRGLLSVLVLLGGLAAGMFYMQDERRGLFAWVRHTRRPLISAGCQLIAVTNLSIVMLLSLTAIGLTVSPLREVGILLLYVLCCTAFCFLLSQVCRRVSVLSMITPPLIVCTVVVCPIFLSAGSLRSVQLLFPPSYYLNAIHSDRYVVYGVIYFVVCTALGFLLSRVGKRHE